MRSISGYKYACVHRELREKGNTSMAQWEWVTCEMHGGGGIISPLRLRNNKPYVFCFVQYNNLRNSCAFLYQTRELTRKKQLNTLIKQRQVFCYRGLRAVMKLIYVFNCTAMHLQTSFLTRWSMNRGGKQGREDMSIGLSDTSLFLAWKLSRAWPLLTGLGQLI
jgi:hypothetical protein